MRVDLPASFLSLPLSHRGLHDSSKGVIENSLGAFRAAVAAGYGIELDVLLSSDGVVMVFHDDTLDRLTDQIGPVDAHSAEALGKMRLKGSTETIPTLSEVLSLVRGQVPLLIEMKDTSHTMTQTDGRLEAATAKVLADYIGPVAVMSFNPYSVELMARLAPKVPRGITVAGDDPDGWAPAPREAYASIMMVPAYETSESSFISHGLVDMDRPRVHELKAAGAAILCWTVRSPEQEREARRVAQNITFEGYPAALPA